MRMRGQGEVQPGVGAGAGEPDGRAPRSTLGRAARPSCARPCRASRRRRAARRPPPASPSNESRGRQRQQLGPGQPRAVDPARGRCSSGASVPSPPQAPPADAVRGLQRSPAAAVGERARAEPERGRRRPCRLDPGGPRSPRGRGRDRSNSVHHSRPDGRPPGGSDDRVADPEPARPGGIDGAHVVALVVPAPGGARQASGARAGRRASREASGARATSGHGSSRSRGGRSRSSGSR